MVCYISPAQSTVGIQEAMATTTSALLFTIVALVAIHGTSSQSDVFTNNIKSWLTNTKAVIDNAIKISGDVRARFNQSIQDGSKELQKLLKEANDAGIAIDDCTKGLPAVGQAISKNYNDANIECSKKALADLQPDIDNIRNDIEAAQNAYTCSWMDIPCWRNSLSKIAKYSTAITKDIATLEYHAAGAAVNRALCEDKALSSAQQSIQAAVDSTSSCVREKMAVTTNPQ